jgi:5-methylcytosine-specific restriction endonuclease McrA
MKMKHPYSEMESYSKMSEESKWDRMIAEEYGEPYEARPRQPGYGKRPACPTILKDGTPCGALLFRLEWQMRVNGKNRRYQSFWGCFRCMAVYHMDLTPALPVPREKWADDKVLNENGDLKAAQKRRENRLTRFFNKEQAERIRKLKAKDKRDLDEIQRTIEAQNQDRRIKLLHLYESGTPHCEDCAEQGIEQTDIRVLQRHHLDGNPHNNKRQNIRILCANCHWKRTMPDKSKRYQNPKLLTPSKPLLH